MKATRSGNGSAHAADELQIRQLIENWVLWRDSGQWDQLATLWLPDGWMMTTWCQTSAQDFIDRTRRAWADGVKVLHSLGGTNVAIHGERAIAQTRMQITQRAPVHDVLVDVFCYGRFWDALEKRDGQWGLLFRQPVYELDRMSPVNPAQTVALDPALLASFPEGYRYLAYLQSTMGLSVSKNMPGTRGAEIEALEESGRQWLAGEKAGFLTAH